MRLRSLTSVLPLLWMLVLAACGSVATTPADAGVDIDSGPDASPPPPGLDPELLFAGTSIARIDITLPSEALYVLSILPDQYVRGELRVEVDDRSVELASVGVRLKGRYGSFRTMDAKAAFLIDTNAFVPAQTLSGLKKLALNNMVQDASMIHERLAYMLFRALGVAAPRSAYARVYVNGELYGLYATVEVVDNELFLDDWFGASSGPLFEGAYGSDLETGLISSFDLDRGENLDFAKLLALAQALDGMTSPDTFLAEAGQLIDMDQYLLFAATEIFLGHWDGYAWTRNNYFMYQNPTNGRWAYIPWGIDQTFWEYLDPMGGNGRVQQKCMASVPCRAALAQAYAQVIASVSALDLVAEAERLRTLIWDAASEDPRKEVAIDTITWSIDRTIEFLRNRPGDVQTRITCLDPATCPPCATQPHPRGGTLAFFCTASLSFGQAEASCAGRGGHLASIHDQATQDAVVNGAFAAAAGDWWIGVNDLGVEGTFQWTDGSPLDFGTWAAGEPNNYNGNEDCGHLASWSGGQWNDLGCDALLKYVCALP